MLKRGRAGKGKGGEISFTQRKTSSPAKLAERVSECVSGKALSLPRKLLKGLSIADGRTDGRADGWAGVKRKEESDAIRREMEFPPRPRGKGRGSRLPDLDGQERGERRGSDACWRNSLGLLIENTPPSKLKAGGIRYLSTEYTYGLAACL